ncbi:MAG: hypothetical protein ABEJ23_03140 [Haloarculaceae archaeon]
MVRLTGRFALVVLLAALAGAVRGARVNLPLLLLSVRSLDATRVGLATTLVGAFGLLIHPLGTALAGYVWGRSADVPGEYGSFLGGTLLATGVGFLVGYVAVVVPLLGRYSGPILPKLVADVVFGLGLVSVALVALAGAALAHFSRPAQ